MDSFYNPIRNQTESLESSCSTFNLVLAFFGTSSGLGKKILPKPERGGENAKT